MMASKDRVRVDKYDLPKVALVRAFALLEAAASKSARCPSNDEMPNANCVPVLARLGFVKVEVFAKNFRRVEILVGKQVGKMTAAPPPGRTPYVVIDKNGRHENYSSARVA